MLRARYDPLNLFDLVPALGMELDPVLLQLDTLLDDDTLFQTIKADRAARPAHHDHRPALHPGRGHPAPTRRQALLRLEL